MHSKNVTRTQQPGFNDSCTVILTWRMSKHKVHYLTPHTYHFTQLHIAPHHTHILLHTLRFHYASLHTLLLTTPHHSTSLFLTPHHSTRLHRPLHHFTQSHNKHIKARALCAKMSACVRSPNDSGASNSITGWNRLRLALCGACGTLVQIFIMPFSVSLSALKPIHIIGLLVLLD